MKKISLIFNLIIFSIYCLGAQQIAVGIPFGNKTHEYGWNISQVGDDFIITTQLRCKLDEDVPSEGCCAMVRVNKYGEVIWKKLMEFETDYFSRPGFPSPFVVRNDSFIVSGIVRRNDSIYLRLFIVHADGTLLHQLDSYHPEMNFNLGMLPLEEGYIVYNKLRDTSVEKLDYLFLKLDRAFNVVKELRFGKVDRSVYAGPCILLSDNKILCAMDEKYVICCAKSIWLIQMDSNLQLESEAELNFTTEYSVDYPPFIQVPADSSLFIWHTKDFKNKPDTFPISPTLYKFDSKNQKLWEKSDRTFRSELIPGNFILGRDENLYFSGNLNITRGDDLAFFRKMDQEGNILWHRYYIDSSKKKIEQYFSSFVEDRNGGFAFTGLIQDTFPNHDPAEFNWDIWFVTLDKNGCFNGDCSDTIYLNQKIPNNIYGGFRLNELVEFYPNPAKDVVHVQFRNPATRTISIMDLNGSVLEKKVIHDENNLLKLTNFSAGIYTVRIEDDRGRFINIPLQVVR